MTVRYLAKSDFGAFSFALLFVAVSGVVALFGLDKAISRYVSIYHQQNDYPRMFGTILLTLYTVLGISAVVIAAVFLFHDLIADLMKTNVLSVSLLLILVGTSFTSAMESYFQNMLAVFASARAIFFRRNLMGPALKLAAVLVVIIFKGMFTCWRLATWLAASWES